FRVGLDIVNMNNFRLQQGSTGHISPTRFYGKTLQIFFVFYPRFMFGCDSIARGKMVGRALGTPYVRQVCLAQTGGRLDQRVQHVSRSKVERLITLRTSAVAVCCCSDSRSSFSRRVFSMAITAWLAKFVTSSICFSLKGRTS